MIKMLKWMYKLGYDKAQENFINRVNGMAEFHQQQAHIAHYRKKDDDKMTGGMFSPKMSEDGHRIAAQILYDVLTEIDPKKFPNIDRVLDKLL